ncbi:putative eukaryotic translation initiation factor 3 subunit EifCj [Emericellopsis cladophorae]|uniref:Eukaryotic translation initiation factor 3 subunit J n=1 Tax=Emericellopsis cladophorae TaxID=2686198 RepID=A0A9P9XXB4_9HYPO|nr:putative eukaryotic translation initiation factor 3 subunit EifCj [Emericellopsis cladophorae]KAI6779130.1 putative eukaryotic translation initiation factor 3 subunit EifCj [Emericellopsis cladophorae]
MAPPKKWDDEEEDSSSGSDAPVVPAVAPRRKFDDEEDDSDVLDSWDAAEDSEVEREKERKVAEAKAKAAAEAAANKKSKAERVAEHQKARAAAALEDEESEEETEAQRRERLRRTEKEGDLAHAEDLFGSVGISSGRKANTAGAAVQIEKDDPTKTVNLAALPLFNPTTKSQFEQLRNTLAPIITANAKNSHYANFLQEFSKQLAAEMSSEATKKVSSSLTALANEKMKAEKDQAKGGSKKTKASKTKATLVSNHADDDETGNYDNNDAFGDDDFM